MGAGTVLGRAILDVVPLNAGALLFAIGMLLVSSVVVGDTATRLVV